MESFEIKTQSGAKIVVARYVEGGRFIIEEHSKDPELQGMIVVGSIDLSVSSLPVNAQRIQNLIPLKQISLTDEQIRNRRLVALSPFEEEENWSLGEDGQVLVSDSNIENYISSYLKPGKILEEVC